MAIEVLRDHIKTMLQTETDIQEVHDYPTIDFNGYPAAVIRFSGNESDYETTAHNERHYVFEIYIVQESESALTNRRQARRKIESLCEKILMLFDDDEYMSGVGLGSDYTLLATIPVVSEIEDLEKHVAAKITVTVRISVNITT